MSCVLSLIEPLCRTVAEAKLRHEAAATQVVAREQELERRERKIEDMRHSVHQLEETQHALQV